MPRATKGQRFGGRQVGSKNKIPAQVRDMILKALADAGGVRYLTEQATANPGAFMALLGKVLPTQITGDASQPIVVQLSERQREM